MGRRSGSKDRMSMQAILCVIGDHAPTAGGTSRPASLTKAEISHHALTCDEMKGTFL